jgi:hypothetical protein
MTDPEDSIHRVASILGLAAEARRVLQALASELDGEPRECVELAAETVAAAAEMAVAGTLEEE